MRHISLLILGLLALVLSGPACDSGSRGGGGDAASAGDTGGGDAASEGDTGGPDAASEGDTGGGDATAVLGPTAVVNELSDADQITACEEMRAEMLLSIEDEWDDFQHLQCFQVALDAAMEGSEGPPDFSVLEPICEEAYAECMAEAPSIEDVFADDSEPCQPLPDCTATIGDLQACNLEIAGSFTELLDLFAPHSCSDLAAFFTMALEMQGEPPPGPTCDEDLAEMGCDL